MNFREIIEFFCFFDFFFFLVCVCVCKVSEIYCSFPSFVVLGILNPRPHVCACHGAAPPSPESSKI